MFHESSNMNNEIVSDNEWVNEIECDPYYGIPTALPQEVVEIFTDYSSDSSALMGVYAWEEEFDYRRFNNLIYCPETNQELCMIQQAASAFESICSRV
ncbi:hypothetical protein V2J09_021516 [Rumex salicifolius]